MSPLRRSRRSTSAIYRERLMPRSAARTLACAAVSLSRVMVTFRIITRCQCNSRQRSVTRGPLAAARYNRGERGVAPFFVNLLVRQRPDGQRAGNRFLGKLEHAGELPPGDQFDVEPARKLERVGSEFSGGDDETAFRLQTPHGAVELSRGVRADFERAPVPAVDEIGPLVAEQDHVRGLAADFLHQEALQTKGF